MDSRTPRGCPWSVFRIVLGERSGRFERPGRLSRRRIGARGDQPSSASAVEAPISACRLFGAPVIVDGKPERLADLGVVKSGGTWQVVAVRTHRREATLDTWSPERLTPRLRRVRSRRPGSARRSSTGRSSMWRASGSSASATSCSRAARPARSRGGGGRSRGRPAAPGFAWLAARLEPQLLRSSGCTSEGRRAACSSTLRASNSSTWTPRRSRTSSRDSRSPSAEHAVRESRHRGAVARLAERRRRRRRFPRTPA